MDTLDFVQHSFQNRIAEAIRQYTATTYSDNSTFNSLVQAAVDNACSIGEEFYAVCFPGEKEVLDFLELNGERTTYRRKDGSIDTTKGYEGYKLSKVGMGKSTYSSAKAAIGSALDEGISLINKDGSYKGKTQLEKEMKEARKNRKENADGGDGDSEETVENKSEFDKAVIVVETLAKIVGKLSDSEQIAIAQMLSDKGIV